MQSIFDKYGRIKLFIKELFFYKIGSLLFVVTMLLCNKAFAQHNIRGKIINEQNEAIPRTTINLKGTSRTVSADENGEFSMANISENDLLLISSIGYEPLEFKVPISNKIIIIRLSRISKELKEVEVVSSGYQDIPKERSTGSFSRIDNATLNRQVGTNILMRLQGVAPGILFDDNKLIKGQVKNNNITIRGLSTINASTSVLIVVDGFIYEGDINNINPNDVDNITLLKDAAAASIWGARAGNGVIVITTKKGKFNQKPRVGINVSTIISAKPDLHYLHQMSSADYIEVEQYLFNQGYFNNAINAPYQALTPAVEIFHDRAMGNISVSDSTSRINLLKATDSRDQYLKNVYKNSVIQQYSVNLEGGENKYAYHFSIGLDKKDGELKDRYRKLNIKVDNIYKPAKGLVAGVGVYYTNSELISGKQPYNSIKISGRPVPYLRLADENSNPIPVYANLRKAYTDTAGNGKLLSWDYYPLTDYKHDVTTSNLQELFANLFVSLKINRALNLEVRYQYQRQSMSDDRISDIESNTARSLINSFSQIDRVNDVITYVVPFGGIRNVYNSTVESYTGRGQLNYNTSWGKHSISGIAGAEIRQLKTNTSQDNFYGYNEDPLMYSAVDFINYYPSLIDESYSQIPNAVYFTNTNNRFVSLYLNASYSFKNLYTLSASTRKDGSNVFGANTNDKWKPLWSTGFGWNISNESFFKSKWLSTLKFRATYGYSGNVDLNKTSVAVASYQAGASFTDYPYIRFRSINNPDLKWEQVGMFNLGADFSLKDERFTGSIEYYIKRSTDLYGQTPYDYTTWGYTSQIIKNVANVSGNGIDFVFNGQLLNKKIKWNASVVFSYNTSKTTKYETTTAKNIFSIIGGGIGIIPVVGKPLYAISAFKWGGLDNEGNPVGYVNSQKSTDYMAIINEAAKGLNGNIVYVGPASPVYFGSFSNFLTWKRLSLSASVIYKGKYFFQKSSISYAALVRSGIGHSDYALRWKTQGDELKTNVPSFVYPNQDNRDNFYSNSAINVLKADNIRLQYINISYHLEKSSSGKVPFENIEVFINGSNLGILWRANKENLDPDYPNSIPPEKTIALGIRANF